MWIPGWLALAILVGCDVPFGIEHTDPPVTLAGYPYRKAITITQTSTVPLADFPVSVTLPADADLAAHGTDARDLAFTGADGVTPLDHEIVAFDPTTGTLDAWTRVPTLLPETTTLYLYYGGPAAAPAAAAVWPQVAGAWHMSELAEIEHDSTSNGNHVSALSSTPTPTTGIVGGARSYNGTTDVLDAPSSPSLSFGTSSFSYSVWVDVTTSAGQFDEPLYKGGASENDPGFDLELGTGSWAAQIVDDTCPTASCIPPNEALLQFGVETLGRWIYLAIVVDRDAATATAYRDGLAVTSVSISTLGSVTGPGPLRIGGAPPFRGTIDEVRIYARALPPAWLETEYANLATRDQFIAIGPQEKL